MVQLPRKKMKEGDACSQDSIATNQEHVFEISAGSNCSDQQKTSSASYTEAANHIRSNPPIENYDLDRRDGVGTNEDDISISAESGSDENRHYGASSPDEDAPHIKKKKTNRKRKSGQLMPQKRVCSQVNHLGQLIAVNGMQPGKSPRAVDCSKCRWKCTNNFDENARKKLSPKHWQLDYCRQKELLFIMFRVYHLKLKEYEQARKRKKSSRVYSFVKENVKCHICKYFLKTLCISHGPVENALSEANERGAFTGNDQHGRHESQKKTKPEVIETVKLHIESFPKMESHYFRKSTKQEYLDSEEMKRTVPKIINSVGTLTKRLRATFGLQSVLQIPVSCDSQMYYSRKIYIYNLTVYEAAHPHQAYCFTCPSSMAKGEVVKLVLRCFNG
ncbi:hypothetical protein PR048_031975 [Dryococelus australis]|uniref:Uncharacterized protein n=1 Tax=Dryococelus australis TaxID=614101 RepID=A0ABQ9G9G0_9NEOP|nr:hypothetical protein PR048_031975 [Dryococelus australis]